MSSILQRVRALPRAAKWALAAGALVGAYFAIIEPALDASARWNARADALQAGLDRRLAAVARDSGTSQTLALAASKHGARLPPGGPERAGALNERLEAIFRNQRTIGLSIKARAPVLLPRGTMPGGIPEGKQAQRLILDVEFEAEPSVALGIISDLERAPEVAAISRLTLRRLERDGAPLLQVSMAPEAWTLVNRGGGR